MQTIKNVKAAAFDSKGTLNWILDTEEKDFDDLCDCDAASASLDFKLAAASVPLRHGDLQLDYTSLKSEMIDKRKSMRGRQILKMVYDLHKTDET